MLRLSEIKAPLNHTEEELTALIVERLGISSDELLSYTIFKRSFDVRKKTNILIIYHVDAILSSDKEAQLAEKFAGQSFVKMSPDTSYKFVGHAKEDFPTDTQQRPIIIGFGPCGILTALVLAQMGFKPIVLERGQEVKQQTEDMWGLWQKGTLNKESKAQFSEDGARIFSDCRLYSQAKDKQFLGRKVLTEFVKAGASEEILTNSKPHIGTSKLVEVVDSMRAEIIRLGGEIRFDSKVEEIHRELDGDSINNSGKITGLTLSNGDTLQSNHIVLAIGQSARDSIEMLLDHGVYIEPKPFFIGFRIEHPQSVIDKARFGEEAGNPLLGAADYQLVHHCKNGRSIYSFSMCPGATVVAETSDENGVMTNETPQHASNANAAIVVGIEPEIDCPEHVLAGIDLQRSLEKAANELGGGDYKAPAQLVGDFMSNTASTELASVSSSYQPGITLGDLSETLPEFAIKAIKEAVPAFDNKMKGFAMTDAILTGVETRTSSPICIQRGKDFQSINTRGLYPAGEGAGYAGGILSAAIDGIKTAQAVALGLLETRGDSQG